MVNLLTIPLWQFGLIFFGIIIIVGILIFLYFINLKRRKKSKEKKKLNVLISAFRDGIRFGYKKEQIAKKAMKNGWQLYECNRALKYLKEEPL